MLFQMLDIYLQEESMIQNLPSQMAVAVLQASRSVMGLTWSEELDLVTGWGREVTQYPTDCLVSLHKLQQEEDVIIIDEGYVSNNWSVNTSSMAGERNTRTTYNELKVFKEYSNQLSEMIMFLYYQ